MAQQKSKVWIWFVVIGVVIVIGLIILVASSGSSGREAAEDEQDVKDTADDLQNPSLSEGLKDCRKTCRIICKANHKIKWWQYHPYSVIATGPRGACRRKCNSDCLSGVDVLANKSNY